MKNKKRKYRIDEYYPNGMGNLIKLDATYQESRDYRGERYIENDYPRNFNYYQVTCYIGENWEDGKILYTKCYHQ